MICDKCGKELKDDAKFCKHCGSGNAPDSGKKARVLGEEQGSKKNKVVIGVVIAVLIAGGAAFLAMRAKGGMGGMRGGRQTVNTTVYTPVKAENGEVRISLDQLAGNKAGYFVYAAGGKEIKFFVMKAADGSVRSALDACQACWHAKLGYRQEGETMVCNNCGMGFHANDIGKVTSGCSPIPVEKRMDGKLLVLKAAELEAGAKYF